MTNELSASREFHQPSPADVQVRLIIVHVQTDPRIAALVAVANRKMLLLLLLLLLKLVVMVLVVE